MANDLIKIFNFLVLLIFIVLFLCIIKISRNAIDRFGALLSAGIGSLVLIQVLLNIAVVTNSMPNTGISLPFFSSGGTSLAVQIFEMGVILSISRYSLVKK